MRPIPNNNESKTPSRTPPPVPPQNFAPSSTLPNYDNKPPRSKPPTPLSQTLPGNKTSNSDVPPPVHRNEKPPTYGNVPNLIGNDNGAYLVENKTKTHEYDIAA